MASVAVALLVLIVQGHDLHHVPSWLVPAEEERRRVPPPLVAEAAVIAHDRLAVDVHVHLAPVERLAAEAVEDRHGAALDLEHEARAGVRAGEPLAPAVVAEREEPLALDRLHVRHQAELALVVACAEQRRRQRWNRRGRAAGRLPLEVLARQVAVEQRRGVGMADVVGMDRVRREVRPLDRPLLHVRVEQRVAPAHVRQVVVAGDLGVPLLRVASGLPHHPEKDHRDVARSLEKLPHDTLVRFGALARVGVVDVELHHHHVRLLVEHVAPQAERADVASGRPDARVDEIDPGVRERPAPSRAERLAPAPVGLRRARALRDGPADDGDPRGLAAVKPRPDVLEPREVARHVDAPRTRHVERRHLGSAREPRGGERPHPRFGHRGVRVGQQARSAR